MVVQIGAITVIHLSTGSVNHALLVTALNTHKLDKTLNSTLQLRIRRRTDFKGLVVISHFNMSNLYD